MLYVGPQHKDISLRAIWDSDSIVLRSLDFFDENGKVLINPKTEYHKPYFDTIKTMLGIERCVDFSFIAEHFMVYKRYMNELINNLEDKCSKDESWVVKVLDNINDQHICGAGFSEYETYGNYVVSKYKDSFVRRPLRSIRNGTARFGAIPDRYAIFYLMLANYSIATFETWEKCCIIRIILHKILTRIFYIGVIIINTMIKCFDKKLIASSRLSY